MKVRFCLGQLLEEVGVTSHGRIGEIATKTRIERHVVSLMINNSVKRIPLDQLGAICSYLINEHRVDPRDIFARLFALEPSEFLSLLRTQPKLTTCFGVRMGLEKPKQRWTPSADSYLHGKVLEQLFRDGERHTMIQVFRQQLVRAFRGSLPANDPKTIQEWETIKEQAIEVDRLIHHEPAGLTTLILGSGKSNPVCEVAIARTFGAVSWGSHGRTAKAIEKRPSRHNPPADPRGRAVPFFFRYRHDPAHKLVDPQIPSCCAGLRLASRRVDCGANSTVPGIYFEEAGGNWQCAESDGAHEPALVLYDYDRATGTIDCVMGGFSGEGTMGLAEVFEQVADQLWPPAYQTQRRCVGVFIVQFEFDAKATSKEGQLGMAHLPSRTAAPRVVRIEKEVLERRFGPAEPDPTGT